MNLFNVFAGDQINVISRDEYHAIVDWIADNSPRILHVGESNQGAYLMPSGLTVLNDKGQVTRTVPQFNDKQRFKRDHEPIPKLSQGITARNVGQRLRSLLANCKYSDYDKAMQYVDALETSGEFIADETIVIIEMSRHGENLDDAILPCWKCGYEESHAKVDCSMWSAISNTTREYLL